MGIGAELTLWLVGALFGSMLFFALTVAPTVFRSLTADQAGLFLRAFFPKYYSWGIVVAIIAATVASATNIVVAAACFLVALLFVIARQVLMPRINRARDDELNDVPGARKRFRLLHRWSVIINGAQMLLLVAAAYLVV